MNETEHLSSVLAEIDSKISGRRVRVQAGPEKARLLLLLSALENGKAFLQVVNGQCSFAAVANARSTFEALVDFRVLERNPVFLQSMESQFLRQKKAALSAAIKAAKRFATADKQRIITAERELNQTVLKIESLPRIAKQSKNDLILDYMDDSGAISAIWSILCDVSHNNINSLAIRHISIDPLGRESLNINATLEPQLVEVICSILWSMFEDAKPFLKSCFVDLSFDSLIESA